MTQIPDKNAAPGGHPGGHIDKDPQAPSGLPEERDKPGDGEQGSSGVGAPKPQEGSRTEDADV